MPIPRTGPAATTTPGPPRSPRSPHHPRQRRGCRPDRTPPPRHTPSPPANPTGRARKEPSRAEPSKHRAKASHEERIATTMGPRYPNRATPRNRKRSHRPTTFPHTGCLGAHAGAGRRARGPFERRRRPGLACAQGPCAAPSRLSPAHCRPPRGPRGRSAVPPADATGVPCASRMRTSSLSRSAVPPADARPPSHRPRRPVRAAGPRGPGLEGPA